MNNQTRAESVGPAIDAYCRHMGFSGEDLPTIVADLICNMLHAVALEHGLGGVSRSILQGLSNFAIEYGGGPCDDGDDADGKASVDLVIVGRSGLLSEDEKESFTFRTNTEHYGFPRVQGFTRSRVAYNLLHGVK